VSKSKIEFNAEAQLERILKFDFFIPGELSFTRFGMPLKKKGYPFDARPLMPFRRASCADFFTTHQVSLLLYPRDSIYAACLPLGFFLPTSEMVRPGCGVSNLLLALTICDMGSGVFDAIVRVYEVMRTRGQTLLELLGLVGVLKNESVDVL
jgi:hypothetical protein